MIRVTGEIGPGDMPQLYAEADVLLMTSDTEGLSNTLVEAMAHGCVPVVTHTRSGVSEVLPEQIVALAAPPGDIEGLTASVVLLARDRNQLARLGRLAHEATGDFHWDAYGSRFTGFLGQVERSARESFFNLNP